MKKVLVITYYWPPSGGAGVQRWLKFVKYLRDFGWEPVVYTPENPEAPVIDHSLEKDIPEGLEVLRQPIWEPYTAYKKFIGQKKDQRVNAGFLSESEKPKFSENLSVWIRGNFFIPDARKFWIKPSVRYLTKYLKENPVDAVVSTGPPHSMHMIALRLKEKLGIRWLADFRDPWTNIDFYEDLKLSVLADRKHHKMEKEVLKTADAVSVISPGMAEDFSGIFDREYEVVTNGFDEEDMNTDPVVNDESFSLAHIGTLVKSRNPLSLWKAISDLLQEDEAFNEKFKLKLVGKVDVDVLKSISNYQLEDHVIRIDYLPHEEVVVEQKKSAALLLIINNTPNAKLILTGKFFEYLATGRPIFCIGPQDGDAARVLQELDAGSVCGFDESNRMKGVLKTLFRNFNETASPNVNPGIAKYSRKYTTAKMGRLLDQISM